MAVKTITVTQEAYEFIRSLKREHESFSHLLMRLAKEKSVGDKYFGVLAGDIGKVRDHFKELRSTLSEDMGKREHVLFGHQRRH